MGQPDTGSRPLPGLGERLREQRNAVGLSVQGLAARIGVTRNTITNYEAGRTVPDSDQLVRLAEALGCDLLDLLTPKPAPTPVRLAFRAHQRLKAQVRWTVALRRFAQACREIEELVGTRPGEPLVRYALPQDGSDRTPWIDAAAEQLRLQSRLPDLGAEHIVRVLEALGCRTGFLPGERGLDGVSAEHEGMALIMLPADAPVVERVIFSAAHELGHLVLHPELFDTDAEPVKEPKKYEEEANRFAGSLLVPAGELLAVWGAERLGRLQLLHAVLLLKRRFHVSFWAVLRRVRDLGLADVPCGQMVDQMKRYLGIRGKAHMEDLEPDPMHSACLDRETRFYRLVCGAFLNDEISVAKVAELLQVDVETAKGITHGWQRPGATLVG